MKGKKLLSTILSLAMALSMMTTVPVQAADTVTKSELVYETVYKETFENIDLTDVETYVTVDGENTICEEADGNKYLKSTTYTGSFAVSAAALNAAYDLTASDYVKIEYDILQSDADGNKLSSGGFVEGSSGGFTIAGASWGSGGNWTVLNGSGATINVGNGEWIHVCLEYNFMNDTVAATMTDESGNIKKSVAAGTAINNASGTVTDFGKVLLNGSSSQGVDGAYDNLVISYGNYVDTEYELVYNDLLTDDFSTDNITGTSYWNVGGQTVADGVLKVTGTSGSNGQAQVEEQTNTKADLYLDINKLLAAKNVTDAATVRFEIDINYDASNLGSIYLWEDDTVEGAAQRSKFFVGNNGGFVWNCGWNGTALVAGNTYKLSVEYDLTNNNVYATLNNGTANIATLNGGAKLVWSDDSTTDLSSLGGVAFGDYQDNASGTYDNLKVSYGSYQKLTTKVSNVEILADGEIQDMGAVHPAANVVKIYFTAPIEPSSVTADSFKINDGTISWQDSYIAADNCVILRLTDTLLPGTTYPINITADVLDANGDAITAYDTTFTTNAGGITGGDDELVDKGHNELVYTTLLEDDFSSDNLTGTTYWNVGGQTVEEGVLKVTGTTVAEGGQAQVEEQGTSTNADLYLDIQKLLAANSVTDATTVRFEIDILYNSSNLGCIYLWEDDTVEGTAQRSKFFIGSSTGFNWNSGWVNATLSDETTLRMVVEYDLTDNVAYATLKNGETTLATLNGTGVNLVWSDDTTTTLTSFGGVAFGDYQHNASGVYDNLKVSYGKEVPTKPELTAENITLYTAMGDMIADWSDVTPAVKTVAIDFERSMDTSTLSDATVYVTKKNDEVHIPAILSYAEGLVSLKFTGSILDAGAYTINVLGTVENSNDVALGDDFAVDFTVTDGDCEAKVLSVKANASNVFDIADIITGSTVTVAVDYLNATGEAQDLSVIFVAYKGEEMSYVEIFDADDISATITGMTYKPTFTAPDMTGVTEIQVMVWNGWDTLKPLAPVVEIK